jgi:hypothetical protein
LPVWVKLTGIALLSEGFIKACYSSMVIERNNLLMIRTYALIVEK